MEKVTIIVAVWNGAATVARCLSSIIEQVEVEKELLVFDGGSSDGTIEIVRDKYLPHITHFESERDGGIYYAWNKGLKRMTGNWVCFLGADDAFSKPTSLSEIVRAGNKTNPPAELVLSRGQLIDSSGNPTRVFGKPWKWNLVKHHGKYCHPGLLHSKGLVERVGEFDTQYRIGADYDFMMRAGSGTRAAYLNNVTMLIGDQGVSRTKIHKVFNEHATIQSKYGYISNLQIKLDWLKAHAKYRIRILLN